MTHNIKEVKKLGRKRYKKSVKTLMTSFMDRPLLTELLAVCQLLHIFPSLLFSGKNLCTTSYFKDSCNQGKIPFRKVRWTRHNSWWQNGKIRHAHHALFNLKVRIKCHHRISSQNTQLDFHFSPKVSSMYIHIQWVLLDSMK